MHHSALPQKVPRKQFQELNVEESTGRNWKGIGIALLVIAVICALVILAIVLVAPSHEEHFRDGAPLTILDITDGSLNPSYKEVQWLSGHELLYQSDTNQSIILHDLTNVTKVLFLHLEPSEKIDSYSISPSGKYLLYTQRTKKVYRHTSTAHYKILDRSTHSALNESWDLGPGRTPLPVRLQYAKWAPSADKLVFVYQNDVYVSSVPDLQGSVKRLTDTGSTDENAVVVYNGLPDWLYEEEILSSDNAVWWSPDNRHLAFLSFNDTMVDTYSFDSYGGDFLAQQYPNTTKIRYPKAGCANPVVDLYIVDTINATTKSQSISIPVDPEFPSYDGYYVTTVSWLAADSLFVRWTNRYQNVSLLASCSPEKMECRKISILKAEAGWLEDSEPLSIDGGKKFLMIMPNLKGNDDRMHNTICTFSVVEPFIQKSCLKTTFDIVKIIAVNPSNPSIMYAVAAYDHPRNRHVIQIIDNRITCVTCLLKNSSCTYYDDVKFSPKTNDYFVWTCRGPGVPYVEIWRMKDLLTVNGPDHLINAVSFATLRSNDHLRQIVSQKAIPHRKYLEIDLSAMPHGPKAQVELLIPPRLIDYATKRYPLLIKVYGGPGSQEVHTRYRMDIEEMLSSAHDVVVARIDARGSGYQGHKLKSQIYRNLGFNEVMDQLEVIQKILDLHPFLDPTRVGIWGWSYGGYASARAVLLDNAPQLLKCAAAVAPVTDWRLYDTAYTERFMSTPQDNLKAYEESNLMPYRRLTLYRQFTRTSFLLVHGTADDNVHFQQAAQFTKALMTADVLFKTQIYPDEDHSIRKLRHHLYLTLTDHFLTCFGTENLHEKGDD